MTEAEKEELVAGLVDEFLERLRRNSRLTPADFAAEHPECADELAELLPMMMEVEGIGRATTQPIVAKLATFPDSLGDYRLLDKLGSGGMGTVFRAMQESLQREVAVKILSPAWSSDARHCEAFANESRVIAGLRHTNIVEVFGAGQEGDIRYYVMSLVKGQGVTPAAIHDIYRGVPYARAVADVGVQAARALAYAHARNVLHRDVKPGNLLLDDERVLHVSDFGLATVLNSGEAAPLVTQSQDGTLHYMAPERLIKGENSFAGDQYSLGLTLYELLTKRSAFREVEPGQLIRRICDSPVDRLRDEGELGAIINKAVSYDPADRYPSMDAMADDLQRFLDGKPVKARSASFLRRYAMWFRRRPAVAVWSHVALLSVVMLFASICWAYASEKDSLARENIHRKQAEHNAEIAVKALRSTFEGMMKRRAGNEKPTEEDTRLLKYLMPYYKEVSTLSKDDGSKIALASANMILADIAMKTEDYLTAEKNYQEAVNLLPRNSAQRAKAVNGEARALLAQEGEMKRYQAEKLLRKNVDEFSASPVPEVRANIVHSLLLLSAPRSGPDGTPSVRAGEERRPANGKSVRRVQSADKTGKAGAEPREIMYRRDLLRAAELLKPLLQTSPKNEELRLMQLELLRAVPTRAMAEALGCAELSQAAVLQQLIEESPDSEAYRSAYIRMVIRAERSSGNAFGLPEYERAAGFARDLLAADLTSPEVLSLYLAANNFRVAAMARNGEADKAAAERSKTLGVLGLLTSRREFSEEMLKRLVIRLYLLPSDSEIDALKEEEISLLLKDCNEAQRQEIIQRAERRRAQWYGPHRGGRR